MFKSLKIELIFLHLLLQFSQGRFNTNLDLLNPYIIIRMDQLLQYMKNAEKLLEDNNFGSDDGKSV